MYSLEIGVRSVTVEKWEANLLLILFISEETGLSNHHFGHIVGSKSLQNMSRNPDQTY